MFQQKVLAKRGSTSSSSSSRSLALPAHAALGLQIPGLVNLRALGQGLCPPTPCRGSLQRRFLPRTGEVVRCSLRCLLSREQPSVYAVQMWLQVRGCGLDSSMDAASASCHAITHVTRAACARAVLRLFVIPIVAPGLHPAETAP